MRCIQFSDESRFNFAALAVAPLDAALNRAERTIETSDIHLAQLLQRLQAGAATVLPRRAASGDEWVIVGGERHELDAALAGIARFVVPTYAEYEGTLPVLQTFSDAGDEFQRTGARLYSAGYYGLKSPSSHFAHVLQRTALWAALDQRRPTWREDQPPSYRDLYDRLNAALSAAAWAEADTTIEEMRRHNLVSADNLTFLEVQVLAQQRRWIDIWRRNDFADIARLRCPRRVRAALLTAFHQAELLPFEQHEQSDKVLEIFQRMRPRLGGLLEGRADTSYGPIARMYAYRAAAERDRSTADALLALPLDEETRQIVEALTRTIPTLVEPAVLAPSLNPQAAVRRALAEGDYATAAAAATEISDAPLRALAMIEIAFMSDEPTLIEEAMLQLWDLPAGTQATLQRDSRRVAQMVTLLSTAVAPPIADDEPLRDWLGWLEAAISNPDDRRLPASLDAVAEADDRYWTGERLSALSDRLIELASSGVMQGRSHLREAVRRLRDYFIQEPEFPRGASPYDNIYEALYLATLEQRQVNEPTSMALLRLAEARLRRDPAARGTVAQHLTDWFANPIPTLEGAAQEALDLLAAYGVQGAALAAWYRAWAETLLAAPRLRDRLSLEGWLALGEWLQPGTDLLDRLRARLPSEAGARDAVADLPAGYQVAIFTLRPESAARVSETLRRRNPALQVRVCDDTVLTDRARILAQSAQLVVVVTTCITHALTYGIGPYLADPVYPQSSGTTSILRAIEGRLAAR